jgi:hypothetical protein
VFGWICGRNRQRQSKAKRIYVQRKQRRGLRHQLRPDRYWRRRHGSGSEWTSDPSPARRPAQPPLGFRCTPHKQLPTYRTHTTQRCMHWFELVNYSAVSTAHTETCPSFFFNYHHSTGERAAGVFQLRKDRCASNWEHMQAR